jgi:hypothetical protein
MFQKILIAQRAALALLCAVPLALAGCSTGPRYEEMMEFTQTVTIDTPTGPVTAKSSFLFGESGVRGASWCGSMCSGTARRFTRAQGEATVIALGEKGVLVALLASPETGDYLDDVFRRFQSGDELASRGQEGVTTPVKRRGPDLGLAFGEPSSNNFIAVPAPFLVWFKNPDDPKSATPIDPENLAEALGPGFALASITVERVAQRPAGLAGEVAAQLPWTTRDARKPADVAQAERDFRFMAAVGNDESYRPEFTSRPD